MSSWTGVKAIADAGIYAGALYRDIFLGLVFCVAVLGALSKLLERSIDRMLWGCIIVGVVAFLTARNKAGLLLGLGLIVGTRMLFTWMTS
jgi:hypothetical protein